MRTSQWFWSVILFNQNSRVIKLVYKRTVKNGFQSTSFGYNMKKRCLKDFVCDGETNMTFQILIIIKRESKETDKKILKHKGKLGKRQI